MPQIFECNENFKVTQNNLSVRAERFEVVDFNGTTRAIFGVSHEDGPYLRLLKRDGNLSVAIELNQVQSSTDIQEHPNIKLYDTDNNVRINIALSYGDPQYPGIELTDSTGSHLLGIVVTPNDEAEIHITDGANNLLWIERGEVESLSERIIRLENKLALLYKDLGVSE